jgi:hypothetical protein
MDAIATSPQDLAVYEPPSAGIEDTAGYAWVKGLRSICETLANSPPSVMSGIALNGRLHTSAVREVDMLGDVAQALALAYGLAATTWVSASTRGFTCRFCRCPPGTGPHPRSACR